MERVSRWRARHWLLAAGVFVPLTAACSSDTSDPGPSSDSAGSQESGGAASVVTTGTGGIATAGAGGQSSPDAASTGGSAGAPAADAAAPSDAPSLIDAGGLETVEVAAAGAVATTSTSLETGRIYLLRASGIVSAGNDQFDAEFSGFAAGAAMDQSGNLDVGVAVDEPANANPRATKWFGAYRADHVYHMLVTGKGAPLSLRFVGPQAATGAIAVTVILLPPAGDAGLIETVSVPSLKMIVQTASVSATGAVYLLQASGSPHVGGLALGQGDAEFCDYDTTPTGGHPIDTENNIDLGIGVDELTLGLGLRKRKWGPYRSDHVYYQLFAGTGQMISFLYHDNGYGDNTTNFTVKMYSAP